MDKATKELVVVLCDGVQGYISARAAGAFGPQDIAFVIPMIQDIGPAVADLKLVPAELENLSQADIDDLIGAVQAKIPSLAVAAEAVVRIRAVIAVLLAAKGCYNAFASKPIGSPNASAAANGLPSA